MYLFDFNNLSKKKYILFYTMVFVILSIVTFLPWIISGTSFVWATDGREQHFPALVYIGKMLREFIRSILSGSPQFKMWDLNIGLGSDVISTLNYYGLGDPLNLLSVFVPARYTEYLYDFLIILRIYLAGISFSIFCFYKKTNRNGAFIGSFIYAFSGFVLTYGIKHPFFINPLIYFPLLLLGLDKLLKKEKSIFFTIMVTISITSNFYFFYMLTIGIFIYALYRVYDLYKVHRVKEYLFAFLRCTAFYILGIVNSMIILLPVLYGFFNTSRSGNGGHFTQILFTPSYYFKLLTASTAFQTIGAQTNLGFFSIALIFLCIMFFIKHDILKVHKFFTIVSLIGLIFPIVGYSMTGFSYIANRWIFLFTFVLAMAFVRMTDELTEITLRKCIAPLVFVIITALCLLFFNSYYSENDYMAVILLAAALLFVAYMIKNNLILSKYFYIFIMIFITVECGTKMYVSYMVDDGGMMYQFVPAGTAYSSVHNDAMAEVSDADSSVYRVDSAYETCSNYSLVNNISSVSSYYSITNGNVSDTMEKIENADTFTSVWLKNFSRRSSLLELAGVKYFFTKEDHVDLITVPYNYKLHKSFDNKDGTHSYIYKNKNYLPLVYGYEHYMKTGDWDKLSGYDKEQSMLQVAVVDDNLKTISETTPLLTSKVVLTKEEILEQIKNDTRKNIKVEGDQIILTYNDIGILLPFNGIADSENYLVMNGIDYEFLDESYIPYLSKINESLPEDKKITGSLGGDNFYLGAKINWKNAFYKYCTKYYIYKGNDNAICNLGYDSLPKTSVVLYMNTPGKYSFKDLTVVCQPMGDFSHYVKQLKTNVRKLKLTDNSLSCTVKNKSDKLICVAIPYSDGWRAKLDGKDVDIIKTNGMYMGIEMSSGQHKLELSYISPGLRLGAILSLIGIIATIGIVIVHKPIHRRDTRNHLC